VPRKKQKGGAFERDVCRDLTAWWTGDPKRDVIFWRTSQSGGRATARARKGKKAAKAHCGDLYAVDEEGAPLTRLVTFELKRGYSESHPFQTFDKPSDQGPTEFEGFLAQTHQAAWRAGTPHWALIHRRDYKEAMIYADAQLTEDLCNLGCWFPRPWFSAAVNVLTGDGEDIKLSYSGMRLDAFLATCTAEHFRTLDRETEKQR
jgi:hypothetical protein